MNRVITIPNRKILKQEKELVLLPKKEYENLRKLSLRAIPEVEITPSQKRAIAASEKELKSGKYLTLAELENELGSAHTKARK